METQLSEAGRFVKPQSKDSGNAVQCNPRPLVIAEQLHRMLDV